MVSAKWFSWTLQWKNNHYKRKYKELLLYTFPAIACWLKSLRHTVLPLKSTHATTQACDDLKTTTVALYLSRVRFGQRVAAATVTGGFTASHWRDSHWQLSFRLRARIYPVRRRLSRTVLCWTRLLYTEVSWKDKSSTCQSESGAMQSPDRITCLADVNSLQQIGEKCSWF